MKRVFNAIGDFFGKFHFELMVICLSLILLNNTYMSYKQQQRINHRDRVINEIFQQHPEIQKQYENTLD